MYLVVNKYMKTKNGFTLLELLVVIGIIGILLSLITVGFSGAQKQSRDSRRRQDLAAIQNAMEQYYSENSFVYPACGCTDAAVSCCDAIDSYFTGSAAPVDPLSTSHYVYAGSASTYTVTATLEKTGAGTIFVSNLQ